MLRKTYEKADLKKQKEAMLISSSVLFVRFRPVVGYLASVPARVRSTIQVGAGRESTREAQNAVTIPTTPPNNPRGPERALQRSLRGVIY